MASRPKSRMRELVREGYEQANYEQAFRLGGDLTPFEADIFTQFTEPLPDRARILDLGCGPGIPYDLHLSRMGHRVTGVDFCKKHLARARELVPRADFVEGDISDLPLPEAAFDAVLSLYTVFHLPRETHGRQFQRIHRTLRPGGICLLTLGTSDSEYGEEPDWLGARMAWSTYSPPDYRAILSGCGLSILKDWFEGHPGDEEYHWWVLAEKTAAGPDGPVSELTPGSHST
jgi:SAM-dependent methyltransferase